MGTKKIICFLLFIGIVVIVSGEIDNNINYNDISLSKSSCLFASKIYQELMNNYPGQNILVSPVSIQLILGLLQLGAEGITAQELSKVLALPEDKQILKEHLRKLQQSFVRNEVTPSNDPNITISNAIYVRHDVRVSRPFYEDAQKYVNADIRSLGNAFSQGSIVTQINDWIANQTNQQLQNVLQQSDVTADTIMLMLNVLYFKGKWRDNGFNKSETKPEHFFIDQTNFVPIPMMHTTDFFLIGRYKSLNITYIELPYAGEKNDDTSDYVFAIYLPDSIENGKNLIMNNINHLLFNLPTESNMEQVDVRIPSFKIRLNAHLKSILEHLGLKHAFNNAQLQSLTMDRKSVQVTDVIHNTALDITEEGTEASAVTIVGIDDRIFSQPIIFNANKPFMFALKQKSTNIILFIGHFNTGKGETFS